MKKVRLEGLDIILKEQNKEILIYKDEFSKQFIDEKVDIRIEILADGESENGLSTGNLVKGLIVCSNYYLPEGKESEEDKRYKTKLEKLIKNGVKAKIKKLESSELIKLTLIVQGKEKYNYYADSFMDTLSLVERECLLPTKTL